MNSKKKTSGSKEDSRPALLPKLRFPGFRGAAGWEVTTLNAIADPVTERANQGEEDNVLSLSTEHGIVLQSEFFGKKVAGDNSERYLKIARNNFVYNDRTTKSSTFGTIKRLSKHPGGIVSPIYKCFRFKDNENPVFWEWYFESGIHNNALAGLVNEGARAGRFNISITQFLSTSAWRPTGAEQQKIAECLSSVDEVIAAQARKVDALKAHKNGLMQQLFPREGETQPRLRFPEFKGGAGWIEKPLKTAAEINPANSGLPESFIYIDLESVETGHLKAKNRISREGAPSRAQRLVERGDIIYQVVRPYQRNNLLCDFDDASSYVASTGYAQLRAKGSNRFLYQSIHTDSFVGRVMAKCTGSNYPAINSSDLAEIELPLRAVSSRMKRQVVRV